MYLGTGNLSNMIFFLMLVTYLYACTCMCSHMCMYDQIVPFHSLCGNFGWEVGLDAVNVHFCPLVVFPPLKENGGLEG